VPDLSLVEWLMAVFAAAGMGIAKSGFSGFSIVHVLIFALLFGARESTGIVLPMLLVGDVSAVAAFRQHTRWDYVRRMLPPACAGVVLGAVVMLRLSDAAFKPLIGWIILALAVMQLSRMQWPDWLGQVPHARWFAWSMGLLAGVTTMLANAAGPIMAIYALAVGLPKYQFVGTSAWLFFILNAFKVPFSVGLGLIHWQTLLLNIVLVPALAAGLFAGRWLIHRVPQRLFDALLLGFAGLAAIRLIVGN
jgi:uncharacterized protein